MAFLAKKCGWKTGQTGVIMASMKAKTTRKRGREAFDAGPGHVERPRDAETARAGAVEEDTAFRNRLHDQATRQSHVMEEILSHPHLPSSSEKHSASNQSRTRM
jgi:hypothetical protein